MKRSCETQLLSTVNDIAENLDAGRQIDVMLLDFSKAFDRVAHIRLCHKLHHLGINGSVLEWIKCFFIRENTESCCEWRKKFTFCSFFWRAPRKCSGPTFISMLHK